MSDYREIIGYNEVFTSPCIVDLIDMPEDKVESVTFYTDYRNDLEIGMYEKSVWLNPKTAIELANAILKHYGEK